MPEPRTIPLTAFQQRVVAAWIQQREVIQKQLDAAAAMVVGAADLDPATLAGAHLEITPTAVIITELPHGD